MRPALFVYQLCNGKGSMRCRSAGEFILDIVGQLLAARLRAFAPT